MFGFFFPSSGSSITCVETCDFALTNRDGGRGGRVLDPGSLPSSVSLTGEDCLLVSIEMSSPAFVCGCSYTNFSVVHTGLLMLNTARKVSESADLTVTIYRESSATCVIANQLCSMRKTSDMYNY